MGNRKSEKVGWYRMVEAPEKEQMPKPYAQAKAAHAALRGRCQIKYANCGWKAKYFGRLSVSVANSARCFCRKAQNPLKDGRKVEREEKRTAVLFVVFGYLGTGFRFFHGGGYACAG